MDYRKQKNRKLLEIKEVQYSSEETDFSDGGDHETTNSDPYKLHFEYELPDHSITQLLEKKNRIKKELKWPLLGKLVFTQATVDISALMHLKHRTELKEFFIKGNLAKVLNETSETLASSGNNFSGFQYELLSVVSLYYDLLFPQRTFENAKDIRLVYCLHIVNHILKARSKIIHHNFKLSKKKNASQKEYRDQGLTRPRVLILVPFREAALQIVTTLTSVLQSSRINVLNKKRFVTEYGAEKDQSKKMQKPEDYEAMFSGNTDDNFKIGLRIKNKSINLYADFYSADAIIASPLGLRTIIGAEGEKDRDFDFLSSIEIVILDQADVFLMQNWEHVLHCMQYLNLQPRESHGCDFFRVHSWVLNGWAKFYRQTILISSISHPWINALFKKYSYNYAGSVIIRNPVMTGSISQILVHLPQIFHVFDIQNSQTAAEDRFQFFISKILPLNKDPLMAQTLIYVPSYLDFVRIRNYFRQEELSCVMVCEYTKPSKVAQARDLFIHGHRHFMLYTERFHFFRRYRIKGIRHIIFYQIPTYPHLYSEICNFLHESYQRKIPRSSESSCTVLYSVYDAQQLEGIVGTEKACHMLNSNKKTFMFVSK